MTSGHEFYLITHDILNMTVDLILLCYLIFSYKLGRPCFRLKTFLISFYLRFDLVV